MNILGFFMLWFANVLTSFLGKDYFGGDFIIDTVEAIGTVYNIFAWLDVFIPVDFLMSLAFLTSLYYGYRFVNSIVKYILELFK